MLQATCWTMLITWNDHSIGSQHRPCLKQPYCELGRCAAELVMLMEVTRHDWNYMLSYCMSRIFKCAFCVLHQSMRVLIIVETMGEKCHLFLSVATLPWGHFSFPFVLTRGTSRKKLFDSETCHLVPARNLKGVSRFIFGLYTLTQYSVDASFVGGT